MAVGVVVVFRGYCKALVVEWIEVGESSASFSEPYAWAIVCVRTRWARSYADRGVQNGGGGRAGLVLRASARSTSLPCESAREGNREE